MTTLLGLDLSARAAAAVAVRKNWDGNWNRVSSMVIGEALSKDATDHERARRCETIAMRIVSFARAHGVTSCYIEGYAYSMHTSAHTLAEVGGVVRLELVRSGIDVHTANMSTSRKFLLGKCPKKDAKTAVFQALRAAGAQFETFDESDAFCAVNWGLSEEGGYCLCQNQVSLSASETRLIRANASVQAAVTGDKTSKAHNAPRAQLDAKQTRSIAHTSKVSRKKKV